RSRLETFGLSKHKHTRTHTHTHTHTHQHPNTTSPSTQRRRLSHLSTRHTHHRIRRRGWQLIYSLHLSHPGLSLLKDPRSSGQLLGARGPSEVIRPSWSGTGQERDLFLFACFCVGVLCGGNPL